MSGKATGLLLVLAGIVVALVGVFADQLGIGVSTDPVGTEAESRLFGWKQVLAVLVGAVLVASGLLLARRRRMPSDR